MTKDECHAVESLAGRLGIPCESREDANELEVFLGIDNIQRGVGSPDYRNAMSVLVRLSAQSADLPADALAVFLENDPG